MPAPADELIEPLLPSMCRTLSAYACTMILVTQQPLSWLSRERLESALVATT